MEDYDKRRIIIDELTKRKEAKNKEEEKKIRAKTTKELLEELNDLF